MPTKEMPIAQRQFDLAGRRVWVAGHRGMVGSALVRRLAREDCQVLTVTHAACDLRRQAAVERWLDDARPDVVVVAAARVGGILANATSPAEFLYDNLMIEANVIDAAYRVGVAKLLFLGSSCIYPKFAAQPMKEQYVLDGQLEPTNEWYAVAKIAGLKLCQAYRRQYGCDFISVMPTNLYGPGDNFDLLSSHVVPALIAKTHAAKEAGAPEVEVWGTGRPGREFLHVDDLADACVYLLKVYGDDAVHGSSPWINVGCGADLTIAELAEKVRAVVGFGGRLRFEPDPRLVRGLRPEDLARGGGWAPGSVDGTPRKLLDVSRLTALGWRPRIPLDQGLAQTYRWYLDHATSGASASAPARAEEAPQ
jgi:GDP-L-fucose synthase